MNEKGLTMQLIMATTPLFDNYLIYSTLSEIIIHIKYLCPTNKTDASEEVQFLIDELENFDPNQITHDMKQTPIMKFVLQPIKLPFLKARINSLFITFH
jgi:hypothetical protein